MKHVTITIDRTDTGRFQVSCLFTIDDQPAWLSIYVYDARIKAMLAYNMLQSINNFDLSCSKVTSLNKLERTDERMF